MAKVIVLFNLKSDASKEKYEAWALERDVPAVDALGSVDSFEVYRTTGLVGSDDAAPFQYVELVEVNDMDAFGDDASSPEMQEISAQFQQFADPIFFMLTERSA